MLLLLLEEGWVSSDGGGWSAVSRVVVVEIWVVVVVDILGCGEVRSAKVVDLVEAASPQSRWVRVADARRYGRGFTLLHVGKGSTKQECDERGLLS